MIQKGGNDLLHQLANADNQSTDREPYQSNASSLEPQGDNQVIEEVIMMVIIWTNKTMKTIRKMIINNSSNQEQIQFYEI